MNSSRRDKKGIVLRKGECYDKKKRLYRFYYHDFSGKRVSIYAKDLVELRTKEQDISKKSFSNIDSFVASKATLNSIFDRYMKTKVNLANTTRTNYEYMYDRFVRNSIGKRKIADIHYSDMSAYYVMLLNENGLKINTLENIQTILHPTFQMAVRDDIILKNPTDDILTEIKKEWGKNKGVRHALTLEQQRAFMEHVKDHPIYGHWEPLFTVLLGTGCRIGEIIGLRWEDIDMEQRLISINHAVVYYPKGENGTKKSVLQVSLPKTAAGIRLLPMMDKVYEAFLTEYNAQKITGFCTAEVDGMTGFIFQNRFGNLNNPQTINRTIKRIVADHNALEIKNSIKEKRDPVIIPDFSNHVLRHTFCTRLCETEDNVKTIQGLMGHKNISTTMDVYAEATKNRMEETIKKLSDKYDLF